MHSQNFPDNNNEAGAVPSYVYSRFSLPRGKMLQRNTLIFQANVPQAQFSPEHQVPLTNVQTFQDGAPASPPSGPSTSYPQSDNSHPSSDKPSSNPKQPSLNHRRLSFDDGRPSLNPDRSFDEKRRPSTDHGKSSSRSNGSEEKPEFLSAASSGTMKGRSQHSLPPTSEFSAEDHVSKAIKYHEEGALHKSTYHLRLAARQNHPTGMLLYALACRHGWGMRPNQKEGVEWLRRAADSASLEVADDEDLTQGGKSADLSDKKARKAQFALSIYELGVSHLNGWGIEQDKVLALRCFEIAGCKSHLSLTSWTSMLTLT
jgi:hypothetical protein